MMIYDGHQERTLAEIQRDARLRKIEEQKKKAQATYAKLRSKRKKKK